MVQSPEANHTSLPKDALEIPPQAPDTSVSDTIPRGFYTLHSHPNGERIDELSSSESPFLSAEQRKKLRTTLRNFFGFLTIAVASVTSHSCSAVGPAGFVEAANLPPDPLITLTGMPDSATGIVISPTPQRKIKSFGRCAGIGSRIQNCN